MSTNETEGTIIITATEASLTIATSATMTKEQVMELLVEALHAIDDIDVEMNEPIPEGAFSASHLQ